MVHRLMVLLLSLSIVLSSCSKNESLFPIDTYLEMTVLSGISADLVWTNTQEVIFPYNLQLEAFNTTDENIMSVNGVYGYVYPKFGAISDLSFINKIEINASDPDNPQDLSLDKEVFYYTQENFNRNSDIDLFPSLPNAKDYIRDEKINLRIDIFFNTPPPTTFDLAFELEFGAFEVEEP